MGLRVGIKVTKTWKDGAFKLFRTKMKTEVPVELADKTKDVLLDNIKDFINANTHGSGRLADSMIVGLQGQDIVIDSPLKRAEYIDEGFKPHWIPVEWLGLDSGKGSYIANPTAFAFVGRNTRGNGIHFVTNGVEMTRPVVLDLAQEVVNAARVEAGL